MNGLSNSAMLVEVGISVWTARKLDRSVTSELNRSKSASEQASRVNKNLLAGTQHLSEIQAKAGALRHWITAKTLPWTDTGIRLLPTESYMTFSAELNSQVQEFNDLVDNFVQLYPTLISAQAFQLGSMFNREEYPDVSEVREKFGVRVNFLPIPTSGDFRLDVNNQVMDELREQYEEQYKNRVDAATNSLRERLIESVSWLASKLDPESGKKRFHDNALDSFIDQMVDIQELNITKDDLMYELSTKAANAVIALDLDDLKKDEHLRKDVKAKMDDILGVLGA